MNAWLLEQLACSRDTLALRRDLGELVCGLGHRYPVCDGIPVLLDGGAEATQPHIFQRSLERAQSRTAADPHPTRGLHPFVRENLVATCGQLYSRYESDRYPIPQIRLPEGDGRTLLDVGCNWGRWTLAAAKRGYRAIGVDPNLEALHVAQMVAEREGVTPDFVVGDARCLPVRDHRIDVCFSYSVLQHFEWSDAESAVDEMGRVLKYRGEVFVQMPNKWGARNLLVQARRRFRPARDFEVRYWSTRQLRRVFGEAIGPVRLEIDGFFGLGVQPSDVAALPPIDRMVVHSSELMRTLARVLPLRAVADSLYIRAATT
jgi:SAM-dependent methyltransferase/uncharacterized protein YbaR (Trm112 family)